MNEQQSRRAMLAAGALAGIAAAPGTLNAAAGDRRAEPNSAATAPDGTMAKHTVRPGVTIACEDNWFGPPWEDGEPIVLLHGVAESHVSWQQWVPVLSPRFRVFRPDLPGFGQSPLPASYDCAPLTIATDLVRLLDVLKVDRFHLVGAKYGGTVALQLAAAFPSRVRTLCVFGTPVKGAAGGTADLTTFAARIRKEGVRGWAASTQPSRLGHDAPPEMLAWWTDGLMAKSDPKACIAYTGAAGGLNIEAELGKIVAPTLVVTTVGSPLQPVAVARAYQEKISKSELVVLPGDSYHVAAVKPQECADHVLRFIAKR